MVWWAVVPAVLAVPATWMGHRSVPGVQLMKTAVTVTMTAIALVHLLRSDAATRAGSLPAWVPWILVIGFALTALADWFLGPLDNSRTFVPGLVAFLLGYLLYAVAFYRMALPIVATLSPPQSIGLVLLTLAPVAVLTVWQYMRLTSIAEGLEGAVIAYMVVATLLLAGALSGLTWALYSDSGTALMPWILFAIGAISIYWSDSLIAHNLFRAPIANDQLWIMPTYYVGQVAVLAGFLMRFGSSA